MKDNQRQAQCWIYAAAIMDSIGCFMITKSKRKNGIYYTPIVKIYMAKDCAINYILNETGLGYINLPGIRKSRLDRVPLFEWMITKKTELVIFLKGILPYLKDKKDRAEHLLYYCENSEYKMYGTRYTKMSDQELQYREESYLKMRELNGVKAAATTKSLGPEKVCDSLNS